MRTAFISVLALASSFMSVLSAPAAEPVANSIQKRDDFDAVPLITNLVSTLQPNIDSITATSKSINADSTDADKAAASSSIASDVAAMVTAIDAAKAQVPAAAARLMRRQTDPTALTTLLANLIASISGASDSVIAALGLTSALSIFNPLVGSLSALLLSLEVVVDNLLILVKNLLDSILTGLSLGLAGLVL